ncbi:hypothetical protein lacNasYZ03_00420 [Lactobacillus nasalidis]|uniref:GGDEF domain-containing protein n=1 Tax=Lactobacillus nasalidis TaxID=2797258 RepID=A0ABQ3W4R0_9LACO|nr:GGDEF domain-containing protein [Lactobacillus nasalidis]GHW00355.1 hypothetical protein lacNasYZ03_00420 [Lactobacillus nasalidis]
MFEKLWIFDQQSGFDLTDYYTVIELINFLFIAGLISLVYKNSHYSKREKRSCYWSLGLLLVIDLAEWISFMLNGGPGIYRVCHVICKFVNYSLIPLLGYCIIHIWMHRSKYDRLLQILLVGNTALQFTSIFTGWIFYIDGHNVYHEGRFYGLYLCICLIVMAVIVLAFHHFEQSVMGSDRLFMFYTFFVVLLGIVIQEVSMGMLRTTSMSITIGMCFLLNRFNNFTQKISDLTIHQDNVLMRTDVMTGMHNRYAYEEKLSQEALAQGGKNCLAFSIDINGLKETNDNKGHVAGDELIQQVSEIIKSVLGKNGDCYRIGGDEFAAIVPGGPEEGERYKHLLEIEAVKWRIETGQKISFSIGYADSESHPKANLERLMQLADQQMYQSKRQYYSSPNHNRRRRRND